MEILEKDREPAFQLEGGGAAVSLLDGLTQSELSERWGYSVRQLRNWMRVGAKVADPVPLNRPEDMPAWFERVHPGRKCPDRLWQAVRAVSASLGAGAAHPQGRSPFAGPPRVEVPESEMGLLAMLERLRAAEATLHAKYIAAVDVDEHKATFLHSEWLKMVEKLRALEKSAPRALEELGVYVRKDDVIRELVPIHAAIIKSFAQTFRRGRVKLRAADTVKEWNSIVDSLVEEVRSHLAESGFAEPLELDG